ncbi:MAG: hypothetical protein FWE61_01390 [Micrococcales bacterium]|nr:hypothetical protein [Micrococcales bacterium]
MDPLVLKSWYSGGEVTTTVLPIEAVDDRAVVTLDFAFDPAGEMFTLGISLEPDIDFKGAGGVRLVDLAGDRVWTAGYDAEGAPAATGFVYIDAGVVDNGDDVRGAGR